MTSAADLILGEKYFELRSIFRRPNRPSVQIQIGLDKVPKLQYKIASIRVKLKLG